MHTELRQFLTAVRFLTILPISQYADEDSQYFTDSVKYFAPVGLAIGITGSVITLIFSDLLPHTVLCAVATLYLSLISGFLHLDGVADTADGFFSAKAKSQILDIMHDSRVGAMGVIALLFLLLLKFSALSSISPEKLSLALLILPLSGRTAIVVIMSLLPYGREEGGLGRMFYREENKVPLSFALGIFVFLGLFVSMKTVLISMSVIFIVVILFGAWCNKMIGGYTGDTLGATCEITETAVAIGMSIFFTV